MNTLTRRLSVCVCAAGFALFSTACSNTAAGLQRDTEENSRKAAIKASEAAEKASEATAVATRNATEAAEAAAQTVNVKTALLADKRVSATGIDVDTDRASRTVILKGHVPSEEQKAIAQQIAADRSTGYHVRNELTIGN
jgi:hyperosmotically inducible periplasmic protein